VLAGLVLGTRLVDLSNVVLMLSPLAVVAPVMGWFLWRSLPWREEGLLLVALALPFVGTMPFIHPGQGYYRDWDDFAAAGMTLSLLTAWLVARALERSPRYAWVAVAAVLGAVAPSLQWLVHESDVNRGLDRVERFLSERPPRTASELARAWDYLGWRLTDLGRFDGAAEAFARLATVQPSPRVMRQWATTEALRGNPQRAQEIYRRMLARFPDVTAGWFDLARLSYQIGDFEESRRAAGELLRLRPRDPATRALIAHLDSLRGAR
jgi:tetratricopeptide (TPR) repeat protein